MKDEPIAYFITFTTYGSWLHGNEQGSVIRQGRETEVLKPNERLKMKELQNLNDAPLILNRQQREIVLKTIINHCSLKRWKLFAVNVLSNHVHIVVYADISVEKIMTDFKAWATRKLREAGFEMPKIWTRHGSTIYIFNRNILLEKISYVVDGQPEKMEYFCNDIDV